MAVKNKSPLTSEDKKTTDLQPSKVFLNEAQKQARLSGLLLDLETRRDETAQKIRNFKRETRELNHKRRVEYRKARKELLFDLSSYKKDQLANRNARLKNQNKQLHKMIVRKKILHLNKTQLREIRQDLNNKTKEIRTQIKNLKKAQAPVTQSQMQRQIRGLLKDYNSYRHNQLQTAKKLYHISRPKFTRRHLEVIINRKIKVNIAKQIFSIFLGSILMVLAFNYLIQPAQFYNGGLAAIVQGVVYNVFGNSAHSQVLFYYPIYAAVNIPFIVFGFFKVGKIFTLKSILYLVFMNLVNLVFIFTPLKDFRFLPNFLNGSNHDIGVVLFGIFAGVVYGTGVGLLFFGGASSCGTDFVGAYFSFKKQRQVGGYLGVLNFLTLIIAMFITFGFKNHNNNESFQHFFFQQPVLYASILFVVLNAVFINRVFPQYRLVTALIITTKPDEIMDGLKKHNYTHKFSEINLVYDSSKPRKVMLLTVMTFFEYKSTRNAIFIADPDAFMIRVKTDKVEGVYNFLKVN